MNACSHACHAAADHGDVTPGYLSLLLARACLLNDFDPFVAPGAQSPRRTPDASDKILLGNARRAPAPIGWVSEPSWLVSLLGV
jgi:hypothetical protein